jgi:hypothetical protein
MVENRVTPITETTIRFFSFFTILTNSLVAIYFTASFSNFKKGIFSVLHKPGTLTAITVYITIVGLVYQVILRHVWEPHGMQMIVDELLHSVIPVCTVVFWYLYEDKSNLRYTQIPKWLIYPLVYLAYILTRGHFSHFYPYPFVDVDKLGFENVITNSVGLIALFMGTSSLFIAVAKTLKK